METQVRVQVCDSFSSRLRGLMFRSNLPADQGLLLVMPRASRLDSSIHMLFVPFDLAVFWISTTLEVVDKTLARAWRPAYMPVRPARYVLELHRELLGAYEIGDTVEITNA